MSQLRYIRVSDATPNFHVEIQFDKFGVGYVFKSTDTVSSVAGAFRRIAIKLEVMEQDQLTKEIMSTPPDKDEEEEP